MDIKLGARILELRKSKGMTQEQLALAVGVSPPAVSKWETDSSCPDIALLCPLARALDTNVDTLLHFEETLSQEQLTVHINEIIETARNHGCRRAEDMLHKLLHTYPSSIPLKYNAAGALSAFSMFFPSESEEKKATWKEQEKQLLEQVRASGAPAYWQQAISRLASMSILDGESDKAEHLLRELPQNVIDPTPTWALLYLRRGEADQALEVTQKQLYTLVHQVQSCLVQMMNRDMMPDPADTLEICHIYRKTEELFGINSGMSHGFYAEAYERTGQAEQALDSIIHYIDTMTGSLRPPNPLLFSPAVKIPAGQPASTRELREMLLKGLMSDDLYEHYRQNEDFQAAVKRLQDSI